MSPLEVNTYISEAEEAHRNDPGYMRWFDALVEKRKMPVIITDIASPG